MSRNLEIALNLAEMGCYVFPCQGSGPDRKAPCRGIAWRSVSTTDPRAIRLFWNRFPDAVPGIDMGKSGLIAFDCDRKQSDGLAWIETKAGSVAMIPGAWTPSGGRHLIFKNTIGATNARGSLPAKDVADIDIRGVGGYIIGPGAEFADGGIYQAVGLIGDVIDLPPWALELLVQVRQAPSEDPDFEPLAFTVPAEPVSDFRKQKWGEAALLEIEAELAAAVEGNRNETANSLGFRAGQLVGGGCISAEEAYSRLAAAAMSWGISPRDKCLGARGTIWRAIQAGMQSPKGPVDEHKSDVIINFAAAKAKAYGEDPPEPEGDLLKGVLLDIPGCDMDWTRPQGLLADTTDWILATSRKPNRPLAVAAAVATLSAVCGRHLYGPTGSSTVLFMIGLGKTTVGKDRPLSAPAQILKAAGLPRLHDSGKVFSMSALEQLIEEHPAIVATVDEISTSLLAMIFDRKGTQHQHGIKSVLLELWNRYKGKAPFQGTRRAKVRGMNVETTKSTPSPALTLLGMSTPDKFWETLSGGLISDGFLNRLLLCPAADRAKSQDVVIDTTVPVDISQGFRDVVPQLAGNIANLLGVFDNTRTQEDLEAIEIQMPWASEAVKEHANALEEAIIAASDAAPQFAQDLMGRTFEYGIRLATIHAVSRAGRYATLTLEDLYWGMSWSTASTNHMIAGVEAFMSESENQRIAKAVKRVLEEKGGTEVPAWKVRRALAHRYKRRDLNDVIDELAAAKEILIIRIISSTKGGTPATLYTLL